MRSQLTYIQDIYKCITRIETYIEGGQTIFFESTQIQDAVIRNFEIIGEATKRLSSDLTSQYPHIPWRQIAGFRDVLIHHYADVDLTFVWQSCIEDIPLLKTAIEEIYKKLSE